MSPTDHNCESTRAVLVAYADAELSAAESESVARHMERCEHCRAELRLLQRSLELAQEVWQEAANGAACTKSWVARPEERRAWPATFHALCSSGRATRQSICWATVVVAASVLLLVTAAISSLMRQSKPVPDQAGNVVARTDLPDPSSVPSTRDDIDRYIAREAAAARLAASAAILSNQPGLEENGRRAEQFIIEYYSDTTAGRELAGRSALKPQKEPQS